MDRSLLWDPLKPGDKERTGPSAWLGLLESLRNAIINEPIPYTRLSRVEDVRDLLEAICRQQNQQQPIAPLAPSFADIWENGNASTNEESTKQSIIDDLTISDDTGGSSPRSVEDDQNTNAGTYTLGTRRSPALQVFEQSLRLALSEGDTFFVADFDAFISARKEAFRILMRRGLMRKPAHETNLNTVMHIWASNILSRERADRLSRLTGSGAPKSFKFPPLEEEAERRRAICKSESENLVKVYDAYIAHGHLMHHPIMQNMYLSNFYRYFWMLSEEIERSDSAMRKIIRKHGLEPSKNQGPTGAAFKWIMFRLEGIKPGKKKEYMETKFYNLVQIGRFIFCLQRTFGKGALALVTPGSLMKYLPLDSRSFLHIAEAIKIKIPQVLQICEKLGPRLVEPVLKQQFVEAREVDSVNNYTFLEFVDALLPDAQYGEFEDEYEPPEPFEYRAEEFPPLG
ncbi:hypothetical protein BDZ85DRAFT_129025 [Elsinoe ampelina]|uniref:Uncharacterized protein n=1 Tax=Elsinoe ampelina TaxID=302913 RepID=A0A6A6GA96_9PEZI|nr:hypothetical protein BDZ85DRAFT_129025 [Elsinoe ampelina]